jgi:hypothetical protein
MERAPERAGRRRRRVSGGAAARWPLVVAVLLFAASRSYLLFFFTPDQSDIPWVYQPYVLEHAQAVAQGRPLFAFHAEQFERTRAREQAAGRPGPAEESHWIEYPPLALRWVLLPTLFIPPVTPPPLDTWPVAGDVPGYASAFRAVMAGADVVGFLALLLFVPRLYPRESGRVHLERWLSYIAGGHVLGHLLYDRLALPAGVLLLLAVGLLALPRVAAIFGFLALAVAVNYQLSPLVLAPMLILGAVPMDAFSGRAWWRPALARAALLAALTLGLAAAFYLYEGPASLGLFLFHKNRGVQVEAVSSTLPILMSFFGYSVGTLGEYNSRSLVSSLSPALKAASTAVVGGAVLAIAFVFVKTLRRRASASTGERVAVAVAPTFAGLAAASLAAAVIGSKVFSPQYLCWLLPLVPLLPRPRYTVWLFVIVAALTTIIFPYAYEHVAEGPTTLGKLLLISRNGAFVVFALLVYFLSSPKSTSSK